MDLTFFKDILFDLINECDAFPLRDLRVYDRENRFEIETTEGRTFELLIREQKKV